MRGRHAIRGGLLLGTACLAAGAASAQEGGVLMTFGLEQRLEAGRNLGLDVPAEGTSVIATTRLSFGLVSRTPIETLTLAASSALVIEDSPDTDGTEAELGRPDLSFGYVREIPDSILGITARFRRDEVDAFDEGIEEDDQDGTRTDYGVALRYETGRTAPVGFVFGISYDATEYEDVTDPDLNDIERASVSLGTRLRFSEVLTGTVDLGLARSEEDDAGETVTESVTVSVGAVYAVSPRLDVTASVGVTEIETTEFGITERTTGPVARLGLNYDMPNGVATADLLVTTDEDEGERVTLEFGRAMELPAGSLAARLGVTAADDGGADLIGGLAWTRELPDGELVVSAERSVSFEDDEEETRVATRLGVGWRRDINAVSGVGLDFSYAVSDAPSERIEQAELGATYRYALTPDWDLNSGLRYRVRDDADGWAESPSVFVSLGRQFQIRP